MIQPPAHFTGDNLPLMQSLPDECVDLIYADPPFNSKRIYKATKNTAAEGASFKDIWTEKDLSPAVKSLIEKHPTIESLAQLAHNHSPAMRAYILYMGERIFEMHRLMKDSASLYLHCDPTASHYLKSLLDIIFGSKNFLNEIIWSYRTGGNSKKHFARKHDVILLYRKTAKHKFYPQKEKSYCRAAPPGFAAAEVYKDTDGRFYTMASLRDVWDINALGRSAGERLGYPTQKPLALLQRIIESSSREGDIILDPFCGCATTCIAAASLNRRWLSMDIGKVSAKLLRQRLPDTQKDFQHFTLSAKSGIKAVK